MKTAAGKPPSLFAVNIYDMARSLYGILGIVDDGTAYHSISLVREGQGTPRSSKCFAKLQANWCAWAGYPKVVTTDRGLRNRREFS